jgi:perosamine synthetase
MEFFTTSVTDQARDLAQEVLRTAWLSEGARVKAFEAALSERLGLVHPVAVNSGTSALHLALVLAGVGAGDEVILPPQTFVASGLTILMQNAVPVFADIDPGDGNISPASIRNKITDRTKAIMPVHWGGYPCDLHEINRIADEHGLAVIEDAAHALGARYRAAPIGAVSRFTCFSFQAIKHLTTGDGGALCCAQEDDYHAARARRWFGIDRDNSVPSLLGERDFDIKVLGYKYHMNDLAASLGLGNLEEFPKNLARREAIARRYRQQLAGVPGLQLLRLDDDRTHANWLFTVLVERRDDFVTKLRDRGVPASVVHRRIDRYSVFGPAREELPGQAQFDQKQVALPLHSQLTSDEVEQVIGAVLSGW